MDLHAEFDVVAKLPEGSTAEKVPAMLQTLLAARFKLAIHRDNKELSGLALAANKGGPKLTESAADDGRTGWTRSFGPDGSMRIDARKITMPALADLVGSL